MSGAAKGKLVAFTSIAAGPATAESIEYIRSLGAEPLIVTHRKNRQRLRKLVSRRDYENAIVLSSFDPASAAATEFCAVLKKRRLHLKQWINVTDDTTAFFLSSCTKIGLRFAFRRPYERSRVKAVSRDILAKTQLGDTKYRAHSLSDTRLPRGFLFPFVTKPILGAGSQGVEVIQDQRQWTEYLRRTRSLVRNTDVRIGPYSLDREVLVEEILGGQECQLDGVVENGRVSFLSLGMKTASYGSYGFRETSGILYRPMTLNDNRIHDARLMNWGRGVLKALGFKDGTFHMEAKVNGPDIHLLEVNPRPGGGANVHAVKLISGIDLNKECIRLWAGGPKPKHEKPLHSSVSFAVRYPSQVGFVSFVRKGGVMKSSRGRIEWIPLVERGDHVDHRLREQYLGVLLAPDLCRRASNIGSTTRYLVRLIQKNSLLREASRRNSR